jgi:hypothetical protein
MRLSDLVPPLGWVTACASAAVTALWLRAEPEVPFDTATDAALPSQESAQRGDGLLLPPRSDATTAAELFSARPLLAEGRRPFVPETIAEPPKPEQSAPADVPQEAPPIAQEPPQIVVLGTVQTVNLHRALLRDELSGTETWYSTGDAVLGWTIVEILPDRILLQLQDAEITFTLFGE